MAELDTKAVLNEYIEQHPVARKAALRNDPFFKAQMETLKRTLTLLETALRIEGLGPDACRRIVNTVVYGSPEAEAAIRRMADHEAQIELAKRAIGGFTMDAELVERLRQLGDGEWKS